MDRRRIVRRVVPLLAISMAAMLAGCGVADDAGGDSSGRSGRRGGGNYAGGSGGGGNHGGGGSFAGGGGGNAESGLTSGQENALRSAESYLSMSGFSRSGLIDQLEFEGYTRSQAEYGADKAL